MKKIVNLTLAVLTSFSLLTAADAAQSSKARQLIEKLSQGQAEVVTEFSVSDNIAGFVMKSKGDYPQNGVIYVDKDGEFIFYGTLIDKNGHNRTQADMEKFVTAPMATKAIKEASSTAWILDGSPKAKKTIYVIGDPNCIYCHQFYAMTRQYVDSGELAIRWIWVGFLKPSSRGMALAIIDAKEPQKLLKQNENGFDARSEQGGIKPLDKPTKALQDKLDKNTNFMRKFNFTATPVVIYEDQDGKAHSQLGALPEPNLGNMVKTVKSK